MSELVAFLAQLPGPDWLRQLTVLVNVVLCSLCVISLTRGGHEAVELWAEQHFCKAKDEAREQLQLALAGKKVTAQVDQLVGGLDAWRMATAAQRRILVAHQYLVPSGLFVVVASVASIALARVPAFGLQEKAAWMVGIADVVGVAEVVAVVVFLGPVARHRGLPKGGQQVAVNPSTNVSVDNAARFKAPKPK